MSSVLTLACALAEVRAHAQSSQNPGRAGAGAACAQSSASTTLTIPKLEDTARAVAAEPARPIDQDVEKKPVPSEAAAEARGSSRTVGYVLLGAGVVSLGVGSYFGLHAVSKWNERNDDCAGGCTPGAKGAGDDALRAALFSDIGFGVGLVAAGVGSYLILSAKPRRESSSQAPKPEPGLGSLQLLPVLAAAGGSLWLRGNY